MAANDPDRPDRARPQDPPPRREERLAQPESPDAPAPRQSEARPVPPPKLGDWASL
mgnify:CR=1 FL=1